MNQSLNRIVEGISTFLNEWILEHRGFACRSFYGETFALALFAKLGKLNPNIRQILAENFNKFDLDHPEFHWEFNRYALEEYRTTSSDSTFDSFLDKGVFKGTSCTNWTLLRNKLVYNSEEVKLLLQKRQLSNGLILDDPDVHSFQYHCFSLALLIEMYEKEGDSFLLHAFNRGVVFIRSMILSNGDTLYIGRGQQQIFGYASLIYALSKASASDPSIIPDLKRVIHYLEDFQRGDGSFPLVMRVEETEIPTKINLKDPQFPGWYGYNNYFDYLPFAGLFLAKASEALQEVKTSKIEAVPKDMFDGYFQKTVKPRYQAVLAKPTGYFSNDLPFPYIISGKEMITPAYGGEQFGESLFLPQDLPLPYFPKWGRTIRWKSRTLFETNRLIMISPLGIMVRNFAFTNDQIEVKTAVYTPFKVKQQYLFLASATQTNPCRLKDRRFIIDSNKPLEYERVAYSASGRLKVFSSEAKFHTIKVQI